MRIIDLQKKYDTLPFRDLELLLAAAIKKEKEFVLTHPKYKLSFLKSILLRYFIFLYKKGYSVAVIAGHKEFYGLDFYVNKHTLIPRPDTELIVDEAIKEIEYRMQDTEITLIDVGTGSGCIPISIIKTSDYKNTKAFATDISMSALRVAKKNARTHNVNINFFCGNLLEPIIKNIGDRIENKEVMITANLPYLTEKQFTDEPSIQREPKNALVAKNNGLALYEELLQQIKSLFTIHNSSFTLLLEIDPSQTEKISDVIKTYFPNAKFEIKKDLGGLDRLVIINC